MCALLCLVSQSCLTLCDFKDCYPLVSSVQGDDPSKNTGVGCHDLLQGIFPTQGLNPCLPYCRRILHHLSHQGRQYWSIQYKSKTHRYNLLSAKITIIKRSINQKCWLGFSEKKMLEHHWWDLNWCGLYGQQHGGSTKKRKIELPFDSAILLLDIHSGKNEHSNSKRYIRPMFATLLVIMNMI